MSDTTKEDVDDAVLNARARTVVGLAVQAAGTADDMIEWKLRVLQLVGEIGALMAPNKTPGALELARWCITSQSFNATFVKAELEQRSDRIMVYVQSETGDSQDAEPLRTEPRWSPLGRAMRARIKELRPGDKLRVYKHMEKIDAKRNVRVLAHFDLIERAPSSDQAAPAPSSRPPEPSGQSTAPSMQRQPTPDLRPPEQRGSPQITEEQHRAGEESEERMRTVDDALKGLDNRAKVAINALCKGIGITHYTSPSADDLPSVMSIITDYKEGKFKHE